MRAFRAVVLAAVPVIASAQGALTPAPARRADEGRGPFPRLIIQNAMVIDGTGGPMHGPTNIVIEGNRIVSIGGGGGRGGRGGRGGGATTDQVIDARGMYVLPGFIDMHVHGGGAPKNADVEYAYKLWLGHGITTVRGVPLGTLEFTKSEQERSARNEIVAPRIFNYQRMGQGAGWTGGMPTTPEQARAWVRYAAQAGVDGLKLDAHDPEIMAALIDEAKKLGLGTVAHLSQMGVGRMNARDAARLGLGTVTHYYGIFEALLKDYTVQPWPVTYNYDDEADRFGQVARLWDKIYPRGSPEWNALIQEFVKLGTNIDPTMTIYVAGRDLMRARNADWHAKYTLPSMWDYFEPSRDNHGSYWYNWTTADEVAWKNFYHVWMDFINDFKRAGGRVTTGSDAGFIYELYGFGLIQEFEMLQEAGFHPLEVVRSATLNGATTLFEPKHKPIEFGIIRPGLLADLVVVDQNPLENFKVLYGTGAMKLNDQTGVTERVGGVKYTIKDGIVYDAKKLLADVNAMVEKQRADRLRKTK
ncbi:MAG TPA: amidohydrolase [Gemmatimonadaceae bacterium]|nr:amidohydrolase [Gemmatimonadaceae bacterium]